MVFKLVCLDAAEPCKVKLSPGKHIIGRERFLFENENDNRVSRNHAEIVVADDEVTLTALHANPCFFQKRGEGVTDIVFQNSSVSLFSGDKFGILPDKYWYELIFCADLPDEEASVNDKEEETDKNADAKDEPGMKEQDDAPATSPFVPPPDSPTQQYDLEGLYPNLCAEGNAKAATKRPLTPEKPIDDAKKVKNEPEDKMDQAGPSNEGVNKGDADKKKDADNDADPGAAGPGNNAVVRERCMYGANCYRKNSAHKAQYSHPSDADWGAGQGEAPACRWGAACCRRDPRHRRDYHHPPRPQLRDEIGKKKNVKREDTPSDLIVNGKRARKPVRNYSWSGSESEGERDPYATDESDEWQPSSDFTDTQDYSQF